MSDEGDGNDKVKDAGLEAAIAREKARVLCCKRLPYDGWCLLDDNHGGPCSGVERRTYGPDISLWDRLPGNVRR